MFRRTFPVLPVLAASLATLAALRAQDLGTGVWRPVPLPTSLANLSARQPVAGNFTGHGYPDIAFLAGSQVGLMSAPSVHNAIDPIASGLVATGLASLPGGGTSGRDALAIATADGVFAWSISNQATTQIARDAWYSLSVGDLDGVGATDLAGIGSAAADVVRVRLRGNTSQTILMPFPGETIAGVVIAQWNGVGPQLVCVATNQRLWIGTPAMQVVANLPLANDGNSKLVRVEMPNYDSLAWLVTVNGTHQLLTASKDGSGLCSASSQQLGAVNEVYSGCYDSDRRGDLLVVTSADGQPKVLINNAGNTTTPGLAQFGDPVAPPAFLQPFGSTASCVWMGDLNADGFGDLVMIQDISNWVLVFRQTHPYWVPTARPILGAQFGAVRNGNDVVCTIPLDESNALVNAFVPTEATHLEMLLFAATLGPTNSLVTQPAGLSRTWFTKEQVLASSAFSFTQDFASIGTRATVGFVRWIVVDSSGNTVKLYQPTRFAVAYDGMRIPLNSWLCMSVSVLAFNTPHIWQPGFQGSDYLARELQGLTDTFEPGPPGGYEEPPDLPPKPPVPPLPPEPPPDHGGG